MAMEYVSKSLDDTKKIAQEIAQMLHIGGVVALTGELGSGKTTFTRYLVENLGISSRVQSPTFVIHRRYSGDTKAVNHFDFYRIASKEEILDTGLLESLNNSGEICIIEWPEMIADILPEKTIAIKFEYLEENSRKVYVQNLY